MTSSAPHSADLAEAMTAYRQDRFDEAQVLLTRHLASVPDDVVAIRWMIRLLTRLGRGGEALPFIRQLQTILDRDEGEHTGSTSPGPREEGALETRLRQHLATRYGDWDDTMLDSVVATVLEVVGTAGSGSGKKERLRRQLSRLERAAEALAQRREGVTS